MKSQTRFTLVALAIVLLLVAVLSRSGRSALELTVAPSLSSSEVGLRLTNRGQAPVSFYDSLSESTPERAPSLASIRFQDASGQILPCRGTDDQGFWTPEFTQTKQVPVVLASLPAGASVQTVTSLETLTSGFDDDVLQAARMGQIRCAIFLDHGVVEARSGWFPLPPSLRTER